MTLRIWATGAYAAQGVEDACLELQDAAGQNVPLLLWAAWTAATGRALDPDICEDACDVARAWENSAIAPLRSIRRALKPRIPDLDDVARVAVRDRIKAVELEAELCLLDALEALSPPSRGPSRPVLDALVAVARVWSSVTPRPGLVRLAERLPA